MYGYTGCKFFYRTCEKAELVAELHPGRFDCRCFESPYDHYFDVDLPAQMKLVTESCVPDHLSYDASPVVIEVSSKGRRFLGGCDMFNTFVRKSKLLNTKYADYLNSLDNKPSGANH